MYIHSNSYEKLVHILKALQVLQIMAMHAIHVGLRLLLKPTHTSWSVYPEASKGKYTVIWNTAPKIALYYMTS